MWNQKRMEEKDIFPLKLAFETKILRHKKIKGEANPFDAEWKEYFEERMTYKNAVVSERKEIFALYVE